MSKNGTINENVEIIPDFENEMIEEEIPTKKKGCGCQNAETEIDSPIKSSINWTNILLIAFGVGMLYMIFKSKSGVPATSVDTSVNLKP